MEISIREQIPALRQKVYGKPLIYFDNAATAQKPEKVIELINRMNSMTNANIHRAVHYLSSQATDLYEQGRESVRKYINAAKREEVIFTSGTTASINLVAYTFAEKYLEPGDAVLITESEHHSNIVPWQIACQRKGAELRILPIDDHGRWKTEELSNLLDKKVKIVAANHISNVLGLVNPIEELIQKAHAIGSKVLIDGAQGIVHRKIDVQKLDCDFYAFSGHKIYAATGTGILYGKKEILEELPPWMGGGEMVDTVTFAKTTYAPLPLRLEAGTPNYIGAASFAPALEYAEEALSEENKNREKEIMTYLNTQLNAIEGLTIYGDSAEKIPLFSFTIKGIHHSDLATLLDKMGIAVRSGLMCAEPLISHFHQTGMTRISLSPYNTIEEAEIFIQGLKKAITMLS